MSVPEIERVLTVSTGHLRTSTREWIEAGHDGSGLTVYPKGEYGWFIHVGSYRVGDTPNELHVALKFAREHSCAWLCFDVDGETTDGLVYYES